MEIINGVEVGAEADVDLDNIDINGGTIDGTVIGGDTPAAGGFTTLKASTDPVDADGVGDRGFTDGRYCLESNNLSDVDNAATAFGNIKQVATESATGVSKLATDAITVTGTATDSVTTPANITAKMAAPGAIGETTPAAGVFTTLEATGQLQGDLINNQMVSKATFDILGLMTDPRFLNLQCEDPGAGTMIDVSGQGHDGTYQGSMTTGDRINKGMGWALDLDGTDDYVGFGDHDDFSFGDGSNDEPITFFGIFEVLHSATQVLVSKWIVDYEEWMINTVTTGELVFKQYDKSVGVSCNRTTDSAMSEGWHVYSITTPGDGGANAMDNVKIYIDGVLVASTATNNALYVSMENLTGELRIACRGGSGGSVSLPFKGDVALIGIDGTEWSVYDVYRFYQLCKGLYGL